jgi:hypothetical protein
MPHFSFVWRHRSIVEFVDAHIKISILRLTGNALLTNSALQLTATPFLQSRTIRNVPRLLKMTSDAVAQRKVEWIR